MAADLVDGLGEFAADAEGMPVDDEQLGPLLVEDRGDRRRPQRPQPLHRGGERPWDIAAGCGSDSGQDDPVPAIGQVESRGLGAAGDEQTGDLSAGQCRQVPGQSEGQSPVAADVAQSQRIVGEQCDSQSSSHTSQLVGCD